MRARASAVRALLPGVREKTREGSEVSRPGRQGQGSWVFGSTWLKYETWNRYVLVAIGLFGVLLYGGLLYAGIMELRAPIIIEPWQ